MRAISAARRAQLAVGTALLVGAALFAAPFLVPIHSGLPMAAALASAAALAVLALTAVALEASARHATATSFSLLATLVALDSGLRVMLVSGLGGFSPIFFLLILGGYAMGPGFGFALGALTMLVSSAATGGLGPWTPYLTYAAALVGWIAGLAGMARRESRGATWTEILALAALSAGLGFLYGAVTDLWFWPYLQGGNGSGLAGRFASWYLVSSAWWDSARALGNLVMVLVLGRPVLAALRRFRARTTPVFQTAPTSDQTLTV